MPTPKVQDHTDSYSLELDASWEIDVWGKIKSQQQSELATYLQTSEAAKAVQTSLVADIANDYYDLLKLDKKLSVAQKNLLLSDTILRMTILRKEAGYVTQLAVQDAEVQRQSTALLIPQYEQQIAEMENALHLLLGEAPGQPIERITKLDNVIVWGNFANQCSC